MPTTRDTCTCPDCEADITANYTPEDQKAGLTGYWSCEACDITVAHDDDDFGDYGPEMDD